jgi:hypothetical protein
MLDFAGELPAAKMAGLAMWTGILRRIWQSGSAVPHRRIGTRGRSCRVAEDRSNRCPIAEIALIVGPKTSAIVLKALKVEVKTSPIALGGSLSEQT